MTKLEEMSAIWSDVQACTACGIAQTTKQRVFGDGNISSRIVILGEGPGEEENLSGHPFVGSAGKLLTSMINRAGLNRDELFIANAVKCWANREGKNRQPTQGEIDNCNGFLHRQLDVISPRVVVAMGNAAVSALTGTRLTKVHITDLVGFTEMHSGRWVVYTFHPSYLLHRGVDPVLVDRIVGHLIKAKEIANGEDYPRADTAGERDGAEDPASGAAPRPRRRRV